MTISAVKVSAAISILLTALLSVRSARAGAVLTRSDGSVLSIEGQYYNFRLPPSVTPRTFDFVVSTDGDKTATCVNEQNRTWFERLPNEKSATSLRFGRGTPATKVVKPVVESRDETSGDVAGHRTNLRVIHLSYDLVEDVGGTPVRSSIRAVFLVTTSSDLPLVMRPVIGTGFKEIDTLLNAKLSDLPGMLLAESMTVTETYEGGKPFRDTRSWTTSTIVEKQLPPALFQLPSGYTHQFPQLGVPGAGEPPGSERP